MILETIFAQTRSADRAAFIPYVMAGDPSLDFSLAVCEALTRAGADLIELGIPYGDPLADGPTIAAAAQRSLRVGTSMQDVFALVREASARKLAPLTLFSYYNPVYQHGLTRFARDAADAGAVAVIIPDVPLEESGEISVALAAHGLQMPLLIAPSTPRERAIRIAAHATGFLYVVSRLGVTGAGTIPNFAPLRSQLAVLHEVTTMPLAVGFGVSRPEHVREAAPLCDGIIVGSALIDAYANVAPNDAAEAVRAFAQSLYAELGSKALR